MSSIQLIKELRIKITDAYKRIRFLETEIQDKVSEINKLQKEFALSINTFINIIRTIYHFFVGNKLKDKTYD